jgi:hypothetical protein
VKKAWLVGLLVATGTVPFVMGQDNKEPEKSESRTAHLRRMYATDRCTYGDGLRAIAGLVNDAPAEGDFVAALKEKGIVPADWNDAAESKLTKGTLAYLLCKALDIKGGATMRLTGTSRRYALRECIYVGLMGVGSTDEYVSGRELLDVMQRAAIWKSEGSLDRIRK